MRILKSVAAALSVVVLSVSPAWGQSLIRDAEIEQLLRDFTDPLLEAAGLVPADVSLYIVNDPGINAFVTGGQNIFMNTGTILQADRPLQLKAVLAHEAGHIAGGHIARSGDAVNNARNTMFVTMGLGILAALAGEGGAAGALMASSGQFGTASFFTYTQPQESAADQAGLRYLEATGQSGEGLIEFFERFRAEELMRPARRMDYFRSHPPPSNRIGALRGPVAESPYYGQPDPEEDVLALQRVQAKIYGFLVEPQFVYFRYPETDESLPARYARAVAYYRDARFAEGREELDWLIEQEPENPFFQELYGQMLFESGQAEGSIPYHARSVELLPTSALLRVNIARSLIEMDDEASIALANDHLRVAVDIEPRNGFAWYLRSLVHEKQGDTALAQLAVAEQYYSVGQAPTAIRFASLALPSLEQGSPDWDRATQIISWATQEGGLDRRRMR
jgi:predicted Zn-dependent protease